MINQIYDAYLYSYLRVHLMKGEKNGESYDGVKRSNKKGITCVCIYAYIYIYIYVYI